MNNLFDCIFVINLDTRHERLLSITDNLRQINVDRFERVSATQIHSSTISKVKRAQIACFHSHLKTFRIAKERGLSKVLILEDDCVFLPNRDYISLRTFIQSNQWEIFYMGANRRIYKNTEFDHVAKIHHIAPGIVQIEEAGTTHAIAYSASFLTRICQEFPTDDSFFQRAFLCNEEDSVFDVFLNTFTQRNNIPKYCANPILCTQSDSFSDIQFCQTSYGKEILESWL